MAKPWFKRKRSGQNSSNSSNLDASFVENTPNHGLIGFRRYFSDQSNTEPNTLKNHVSAIQTYIEENQALFSIKDIIENGYFVIDYHSLQLCEDMHNQWKDFKDDLVNNPEFCLKCMSLAMHQYTAKYCETNENDADFSIAELEKLTIYPRLIYFEPVLQLKDLRVNCYGKLVNVRGTVIKAGHVNVVCQNLVFECKVCTSTQLVRQLDGAYTLPTKCQTKGCRAQSNFSPVTSSEFTKAVNWQKIKIQELLGTEQCDSARVPRTLDCELTEDLVNSCVPGDDITVTGIIKVRDPLSNGGKNMQNTVFSLYMETVSLWSNKRETEVGNSDSKGVTLNEKDYKLINKLYSTPKLFKLLVHSLCPNIYGHEIVKAGLILALFGGTKSDLFRAESHALMVGDPGLGKSQMLQACSNVAPRGIFVCGNTSTTSGLTVAMTREHGEYALEAGALMLADQGCCCIDEFDKMPSQHACLLEAMEQQSISIAKAGVLCNIPTRATILSAANPAGGHYNKGKTIAENLKIASPMLSRFDLIFILLDQANEHIDVLVSKHILRRMRDAKENIEGQETSEAEVENQESLRDRLKSKSETIDHLPHVLLRKYLAYAQKYVKPHLSAEAKGMLRAFYLTLREEFQTGECTPITTRKLKSLIRLTQARAKAELREEATAQDAADVVEIMKFSLADIFTDNCGILDKTRTQDGTGIGTRGQVLKLLKILQQTSETDSNSIFALSRIKELGEQVGIKKDKIYNIVQGLNLQGFLLSKGQKKYQLVTADL